VPTRQFTKCVLTSDGDPALLLPIYYKVPFRKNKYEIGIIPHYVDFKKVKRKLKDGEVNVINICDSVENVIYEIVSCERTISSSLHGLIVSHAYRVPSLWAEFSNRIIGKGFKFKDYLLSVNLDIYDPLDLKYTIPNRYELLRYFENKRFDIKIDLEPISKPRYQPLLFGTGGGLEIGS
jgi:pyruvyltransferase